MQKQLLDDDHIEQGMIPCSVLFKIEIIDQGIGMPQENLKNLFLAFGKQEDKLKLNREGTGLGLSICKHIIEQMGGSVKVHSEVDEGTNFKVTLRTQMIVDQKLYDKLCDKDLLPVAMND